ncbi:M60 family metallopeptidase [Halosquirtibacter laminarini]|uniref:M60 family metallopeptidase n=1 Tax=Halosquirtibacter laminarini TaxID=3374600 RepID=A0AC61NPS8_9BACT|nr:M60 family metallopeptidase [Prolixibacteraceae bacterium]
MKIYKIFLAFFFFTIACKEEETLVPTYLDIENKSEQIFFSDNADSRQVIFSTNASIVDVSSSVDWCTVSVSKSTTPEQKVLNIDIANHEKKDERTCNIFLNVEGITKKISITQLGITPQIIIPNKEFKVNYKSQVLDVLVSGNIDLKLKNTADWIVEKKNKEKAASLVEHHFHFEISRMETNVESRATYIYFSSEDKSVKDSIQVIQVVNLDDNYTPSNTDIFPKDTKLKVLTVSLSPSSDFQSGYEITKAMDGDYSTYYHSKWPGVQPSNKENHTFVFDIESTSSSVLNYIVLHPRQGGVNGIIKDATVWAKGGEDNTFIQIGEVHASNTNSAITIKLETPIVEPMQVKIVVTDTFSKDGAYHVSLAEAEFFQASHVESLENDIQFFEDETFSKLKPGVTIDDIENSFIKNIALYLITGRYDEKYRIQNYEPYRPIESLKQELKTNNYSAFENPTGIFFQEDQDIVLFVGETHGEEISLKIHNFGSEGGSSSYLLSEGFNLIQTRNKGNGYIQYYTPNYEDAKNIKVHIASGKINGLFRKDRDDNTTGSGILDHTTSEILDIVGDRVHLAFPVSELNKYCRNEMHDLIVHYDSIISSEQTMMGLRKYKRLPKNHMFGRVVWSGYMFADGMGAGFHNNTMASLLDVNQLKIQSWGIAHEFGHVNQVRPGMMWVRTAEVTNNIYSTWAQYCFSPNNLRLENENVGGEVGGRWNAFLQSAFINGEEWGLQGGPDFAYEERKNGWGGDFFVANIPLWQLMLYYHIAGDGNSWGVQYPFADIFEKCRVEDQSQYSEGELQMNFVRNFCDVVKEDLSDFFISCGILIPVDKKFEDYRPSRKTITQEMVDQTIEYIRKYQKPSAKVKYISGNSIDAYKYHKRVEGTFNNGVSGTTTKTIQGSVWKNITVYETYQGDSLIDITLVFTGDVNKTFTKVSYPSGATRIEAVGYDGSRTLVYGTR